MRLLDSRRLPGPNLYSALPSVIAEVALDEGETAEHVARVWQDELARLVDVLTDEDAPAPPRLFTRPFRGGVTLVFTAAPDRLLTATLVNDWAIASATSILAGAGPLPVDEERRRIADALYDEGSPRLLDLWAEARARGVPLLEGEDEVSLGHGARSRRYERRRLPRATEVPWGELGAVPIALVTGTNGKTTTARMIARIARRAGRHPGLASTDGITVDEREIEEGDWTGPMAARAILRRGDVDLAVLETARGGILRRGLAVDRADVAVITNVSEDHLGDYGVDDVDTMLAAKAVVTTVARCVVLNADDARVRSLGARLPAATRVLYFARTDDGLRSIQDHLARGGEAVILDGRALVRCTGTSRTPLVGVDQIPITFGGAAPFHVENALAAAAAAWALGLPDAAIRDGLASFGPTREDNPGRTNLVEARGVRVLIDFGHNPAGVRAAIALARSLLVGQGALTVIAGMPGDRTMAELAGVAQAIADGAPRRVHLRDLDGYLRGKAPGEVPRLLTELLTRAGVAPAAIADFPSEPAALEAALAAAAPGDVLLLLAHLDKAGVARVLDTHDAR